MSSGVLQLGCTLPLWGVGSALAHVAVVDIQVCHCQHFTHRPPHVTLHASLRVLSPPTPFYCATQQSSTLFPNPRLRHFHQPSCLQSMTLSLLLPLYCVSQSTRPWTAFGSVFTLTTSKGWSVLVHARLNYKLLRILPKSLTHPRLPQLPTRRCTTRL